jgi:hypothetical protein
MKIVTSKNTTAFYCKKEDFEKLRAELNKICSLRTLLLIWCDNRYTIKYPLTDPMKEKVLSCFSNAKEVDNKNKIIRGHLDV